MASIPYRPEIDGLRAFSIAAVVVFHLFPGLLPGGYLGVDIFFVISGYLITSIMLADSRRGELSLRDFWARRIRRILPAAAFLLVCVLVSAVALDYPQRAMSIVGRQAFASAGFLANIAFKIMAGDYWSPAAETLVLLHHWSLAVEEQFYLLYPLGFIALIAAAPRRTPAILAALGALSLTGYIVASRTNPSDAFYLPHYRAWELLAGCLLAYAPARGNPVLLARAGLSLMFVAICFAPLLGPVPGLASLVVVTGAALSVYSAASNSTSASWLARPIPVAVGKASYSLYLWHWPCIVFSVTIAELLEYDPIRWISIPLMVVGTLVSYKWIEPLGRRIQRPFWFAATVIPILLFLSALATLNTREPRTGDIRKPSWLARAYDCVQNPPIPLVGERHVGFILPDASVNPPDPEAHKHGILAGSPGRKAQWYLLGDSHALMWANQLSLRAKSEGKTLRVYAGIGLSPLLVTTSGAGLDSKRRAEFNSSRLENIAREQPEVIVLAMRWDSAVRSGEMPKVVALIQEISGLSPATRIVIVGQPPVAKISVNGPQWVSWRLRWGAPIETAPLADIPAVQDGARLLGAIPSSYPQVTYVDPAGIFMNEGRVNIVSRGEILYRDDDHLSEAGAALAASIIVEKF